MFDTPSLSQTPPPGDATLSALVAKAERGQWDAADVFDGSEKTALPVWLPGKFHAAVVSQLYHGERATITMCRKLLPEIDDSLAKRLVEFQIADEERHAKVYLAYLEGFGRLQPPDPTLKAAYEKALSLGNDDGAMMAAFTIILEGEALFAMNYLGRWLRCPRFRRINASISKDEARHYAFGRAYLKQKFSGLGREQRLDVYHRLKELWHGTAGGILEHFPIPNFILRRRCRTCRWPTRWSTCC